MELSHDQVPPQPPLELERSHGSRQREVNARTSVRESPDRQIVDQQFIAGESRHQRVALLLHIELQPRGRVAVRHVAQPVPDECIGALAIGWAAGSEQK